MATVVQDLGHALRSLRKRAGFTFAAVATIAVGIGANVTVFSLVDALLLRPLPFGERSDRVVTLHSTHPLQPEDWDDSGLSYPDLLDVRSESQSFEAVGGMMQRNFTVTTDAEAERLLGLSLTPDVFPALGVQPMLGRRSLTPMPLRRVSKPRSCSPTDCGSAASAATRRSSGSPSSSMTVRGRSSVSCRRDQSFPTA